MKILQRVCLGLFAALIVSNSLQAHEFWMEPENPSVSVGDTLKIKLRVGQHLKGNQQPYIKSWFEEFQIRDAEGMRPVKGMQGDMSVLQDYKSSITCRAQMICVTAQRNSLSDLSNTKV